MKRNIKNIGLMITKNEEPILKDILDQNIKYIDELYVLDGSDGNKSYQIFKSYPQLKYYVHESDLSAFGTQKVRDGIRQYLLEQIIKRGNIGNWITLMHGDELFYHDPKLAAKCADFTNSNCIKWFSPHFFPHLADFSHWEQKKKLPVDQKFTWYAHNYNSCWAEDRQFKLIEGMSYELKQHRNVMPSFPEPKRFLPGFPILRHFKVWNLNCDEYAGTEKKNGLRVKGKFTVIPYYPTTHSEFFIEKFPSHPCASQFKDDFGKLEVSFDKLCKFCDKGTKGFLNKLAMLNLSRKYWTCLAEKTFFWRLYRLKMKL